uniref:Ribosomal protein S2 n=1 Tax=Psilotum nudum TaxID=3240 RepID=A0A1B3TRI4_PSINU|nr:ribosomal protein S2 [Psilotum nudum]AOH05927.1 ribosomal protein S2 [Psilotum nudum]
MAKAIARESSRKNKINIDYSKEEKEVIFQRLPSTSAHLGYRRPPTPYYEKYSCGFRNKRAIIDSERTLLFTKIACDVIRSIIRGEGHSLLVNTDPFPNHIIERMAKKTNQSHVSYKWIGGFSTNWKHMNHGKRLEDLSAQHPSPRSLKMRKSGLMTRQIPDRLVILNAHRDFLAILEANRLQIPIVSLVDSTLPKRLHKLITYPIPVNNDSIQFADPFCKSITKTVIHLKRAHKLAKKAQ